ncbi:MAG: glycosyltransferase [Sneathiellaceae bacterium]
MQTADIAPPVEVGSGTGRSGREQVRLALARHGLAVLRGYIPAERIRRFAEIAGTIRAAGSPNGRRLSADALAQAAPGAVPLEILPAPEAYKLLHHLLGPGYALASACLVQAGAAGPAPATGPADPAAVQLDLWLPLDPPPPGTEGMMPGDLLLLLRGRAPLAAADLAERVAGASLALAFSAPGRGLQAAAAPASAAPRPFDILVANLDELVSLGREAGMAGRTDGAATRLLAVMARMMEQASPEQVLPPLRRTLQDAGLVAAGAPPWAMPEDGPAAIPPAAALAVHRRPTFGLCMAVRNHASMLDRSLGGIAGQLRPFDRIVLVNDASDDATPDRLKAFAAGRADTLVLHNAERMGPVASIRRAVAEAGTDYLAWAAADDLLLPGMLLRLAAAARRWPQAGLLLGETGVVPYRDGRFGETGPLIHGTNHLGSLPDSLSPVQLAEIFACRRLWFGTAWILRRDALEALGGFDPEQGSLADYFALLQVLVRHGAGLVPERLAVMTSTQDTYSQQVGRTDAAITAQRDAVIGRLKSEACGDVYPRVAAMPGFILDMQSDTELFTGYFARRPEHWDLMLRAVWWGLRHGELAFGRGG